MTLQASFSIFISDLKFIVKYHASGEEHQKDLTKLRGLKGELQGRLTKGSASWEE